MRYLDVTLSEPMENLALDEALIDWCEAGRIEGILRTWEPRQYFIVLGYSNKIAAEVNLAACEADGVPVLRRCTGGGAVLQGPGCLNYALVLRHGESPGIGDLTSTYHFVLGRHRRLFSDLTGAPVTIEGTSDLALGDGKFSGNSLCRKRYGSLIHGTFLLGLDPGRMERYLAMPSRQPAYRHNRTHRSFVRNLGLDAETVKRGLREIWDAFGSFGAVRLSDIDRLVQQRYGNPAWNKKF